MTPTPTLLPDLSQPLNHIPQSTQTLIDGLRLLQSLPVPCASTLLQPFTSGQINQVEDAEGGFAG